MKKVISICSALVLVFTISMVQKVNAQDYLISFAGTGASTTVSTVEVENLSTGKTVTLSEGDILNLTSVVGISQPETNRSSGMRIYPNPMMDNSILELHPQEAGDAVITVYEMTGKTVAKISTYLEKGRQEFRLSGLKNGLYLINARGNSFQYSGKILCSGQADGNPRIEKVANTNESNIEKISKKEFNQTQGTVDMYYTAGERLKFKAISGIYSTVKTDIPTEDKTLSFNFIPCTDGDNNNYPVVEIGEQIWMAENLKTTKYNDGTAIPLVIDDYEWGTLETPGFCWYDNDSATYNATYGALYNWYTGNTGKLCPTGWHVPNKIEWNVLRDYLGEEDIAGGKLKEAGFSHWYDPNTSATNETGFTALPGGYRDHFGGSFSNIGFYGAWWSSTQDFLSGTLSLSLENESGGVYRFSSTHGGDGIAFRCLRDLPTLTTLNATEITTTSAISGGNITDDWGYPVTARGVCWSTHKNPTIADGLVTSSNEVDSFTCLITGLTINTKYYVRAYATNSLGTAYGNEIMFATKGETGSVSDIDGNTYSTIEIGTQTWMAENLKTRKFNDGKAIQLVTDAAKWAALSTSGYCWYNNDSAINNATYGTLYNWYVVNTRKLCPTGWHVPSDAEWTVLTDYLGGEEIAGGKLKEAGLAHWADPNTGATNETGFTGLPGGYRSYNGYSLDNGIMGIWWSTTIKESDGFPGPVMFTGNTAM